MSKQIHDRRIPFERPPRIRSMLTLSVATEVLALAPAKPGNATLQFREQTQEFDAWYATIVAGSSSDIATAAAENDTTLGIVAPRSLADEACASGLPIRRVFSFADCEVICSANAPDDFVETVCRAIEATTIGCRAYLQEHDSSVPLHSAAEQFWLEK